jgi:ectoine hydroxylase-related dioxygenase (phytanoyl-CoA dioxygenase family)
MPTVHASLEGDCQLQYAGLVLSLPGSDDQGWHTDGEHLFPGFGHHTPPHAVTVFVPLVNLTEANGCPQFFVGSHVEAVATALSEGTETDPPVTAELSTGSALIFDYRLVHRGTGNSTAPTGESSHPSPSPSTKSAIIGRPLLYFVYSKSWYNDNRNFSEHEQLFA